MAGNVEEFLRRAIQQKLGKRFEEVEVLSTDELQPIPATHVHEEVSQLAPQGLRQLFQSKSALRNAIIFREIIDRPADRW